MVVFPFVLAISPIEVVWIDNNREFWQPPVMDLVHGHDVLAVMVTDPLEAWIYVAFGCLLLWRAGLPLIHWLRSISIPEAGPASHAGRRSCECWRNESNERDSADCILRE